VTVSDGGTVKDGTTTIGNQPGSTGTVDVSWQGSTLNTTGTAVISASGSGTLDISNGGVVNDGSTTIAQNPGSNGTADVSGQHRGTERRTGSDLAEQLSPLLRRHIYDPDCRRRPDGKVQSGCGHVEYERINPD
jgi:T5SS/PEP-CTERM-associated repeat protein